MRRHGRSDDGGDGDTATTTGALAFLVKDAADTFRRYGFSRWRAFPQLNDMGNAYGTAHDGDTATAWHGNGDRARHAGSPPFRIFGAQRRWVGGIDT